MNCGIPGRVVLQWHVTERCLLNCTHCYQEGLPEPDEMGRDAILCQYFDLLDHLDAQRGVAVKGRLHITGGDPFLVPGFLGWLERIGARRPGLELAVMATGLLVTDSMARRLAALNLSFFQVSLDGKAETHDAIRGQGNHARVLESIRRMTGAGLYPTVSFTANSTNWSEFPLVVEAARKAGARSIWSDRWIPCGPAIANGLEAMAPDQVDAWMALMGECRQRETRRSWGPRIRVSLDRALQFRVTGRKPYSCHAGRDLLTILSDGSVVPCRRMPVVLGQLPETTLVRIWEESSFLQELREPASPVGCAVCVYRNGCEGGLRCLASAVLGDPFAADPGCSLAVPPARKSNS